MPRREVERSLLRAVCDLDEVVVVWADEGVLFVNDAAARLSGYSLEELRAMPSFFEIVVPEQRERVMREGSTPGYHLMTITRKDGQRIDLEVRRHPVNLDGRHAMVSVGRDITTLAEAQRQLAHAATHDEVTGLPNERRLLAELREALAEDGTRAALLVIDLDGVKEVNETFGRRVGDLLLGDVATRLRERLGERGTLARIGGAEFAVLVPRAGEQAARSVVSDLLAAIENAFRADGHSVVLRAVAGIATFPRDGQDAIGLLRAADGAAHEARRQRRGWAVSSAQQDAQRRDRLDLMADLREAIVREQLLVHYQPLLNLGSRRIVGAEALARWSHPSRGFIPPAVFVPLAARIGFGRTLTDWVLARALDQYRAWHVAGQILPVLVNVSASDLVDPAFLARVESYAQSHRVSEKWLKLEITESELVADHARVAPVLRRIHELGGIVAIDDYGTGYSSLSYLHRLPVDAIKLDRSFALGLAQPRIAAIVRSTIALGHELGYLVGAEGVEDGSVLDQLAAMRCDFAQGYAIARPMPAEALTRWLPRHAREATLVHHPIAAVIG